MHVSCDLGETTKFVLLMRHGCFIVGVCIFTNDSFFGLGLL